MRGINLDHLRTFAEVAKLGSFSTAAEQLQLTQPAVSWQMRQLERRFGVRLLDRTGRRAIPTAAGLALLEHISKIDSAVDEALRAIGEHATAVVGRVRLGAGASACIYVLPPLLRELRQRFPSLEIMVRTGNASEILKGVERNTLDVALVTMPIKDRIFHVEPVLEDEMVAIFPSGGVGPPTQTTPAALAKLPLVVYESGGNSRRLIDDWFRRGGASLKPVMELGSVEAIKELVRVGLGCGLLPRMAMREGHKNNEFIVRSLRPRLPRTLAIVLRHDKPLQRALSEVVKALRSLG